MHGDQAFADQIRGLLPYRPEVADAGMELR